MAEQTHTESEEHKIGLTVVTALAGAQLLHETMDDLMYTPYYRQSLKAATNKFEKEITKLMDNEITKMYQIDEGTMRQIQDGIQAVAKELAHMDPARIVMLGELLKNGDIEFVEQ